MRLLLAAASGLTNWPLSYLPVQGDARIFLSGAIFGALVLVPCIEARAGWIRRAIVLVAGGMAIHFLTLRAGEHLYASWSMQLPWVIVACGPLGALLVAALTRIVAPLAGHWKLWASSALAGLLGGLAMARALQLSWPSAHGLWTASYAIWQVLVCAALCSASTRSADTSAAPVHPGP